MKQKNVRTILKELKSKYKLEAIFIEDTKTNIQKGYYDIHSITEYQKNKIVNAYFFSLDKSILMIYCKTKKHATP